jgi:hypothetical protein
MAEHTKDLGDLGLVVHYHAADGDDTPELVAYPLCAGMDTFAAIVARVHRGNRVDLMVLDPSRGPMPRWKVPYSSSPKPGTWSYREDNARDRTGSA